MNLTVITGATSGIGEALAHQLAARKHNLLLIARNEQKLQRLCKELSATNGIQAQYIVADLSKSHSPTFVFEETQKRNLSVHVLINNAGIGSSGEFVKNDLQSELELLQLNNASLVSLCRLFLPDMIKCKSGVIINVGSLASFFPSPYMAIYAASKAFVRSFTEALTQECKPYSIHVMLFCPGFTSTNFMNTPANNNEWGKTLVKGAYTQTSQQVALEMIGALEKKKTQHISGRRNSWQMSLVKAFIPNATIAKIFAERKRREMGL